jgi:putative endonuclease
MWVYILFSELLDRYYIGVTSNLGERIKKHNRKNKGFTGRVNDWQIVYKEEYSTKQEALSRETELKSWKSREKIERLISSLEQSIPITSGVVKVRIQ